MASIVALTPFLWSPADLIASTISAHFEGGDNGVPKTTRQVLSSVAIVKITSTHFQSGYGAQSPLDRCVLAADLQHLFDLTKLKVVAVDFDLAPYRMFKAEEDEKCQARLDEVLDEFAKSRSLILMQPTPRAAEPEDLECLAKKWERKRLAKGAQFAHVEFRRNMGVARNFVPFEDDQMALGIAFREALLKDAGVVEAVHLTNTEQAIAVRGTEAFFQEGRAVSLDKVCTSPDDRTCDIKAALVGSGYSSDDQHVTFSGQRDGVDLHAAVAACPKAGASHFQHFLLDVVLGVFLGWVFSLQWKRYYETVSGKRLADRKAWLCQPTGCVARACWWATPSNPAAAYGWFAWMLLFSVAVLLIVSWASLQIFGGACATAIFPAGIVIGMFIEAAIVQGPETAAHLMSHASVDHDISTQEANALAGLPPPKDMHVVAKTVVALVFSLWTFFSLMLH